MIWIFFLTSFRLSWKLALSFVLQQQKWEPWRKHSATREKNWDPGINLLYCSLSSVAEKSVNLKWGFCLFVFHTIVQQCGSIGRARRTEVHPLTLSITAYTVYRLQWLRYVPRSADRVVVMGLIAQDWWPFGNQDFSSIWKYPGCHILVAIW